MYFQLFSRLVDWIEKHVIVDQKPGEKVLVFGECHGVFFLFLVGEFSIDRVLERIIMRCSFFKSRFYRVYLLVGGLRL